MAYFWSLQLPHKELNCWWRLLKNCISSLVALHARWETRRPSPTCRLCHNYDEDVFHLFVGCHHKWSFWSEDLPFLSLDSLLPTSADVWAAIIDLHTTAGDIINHSQLVLIGCIIEIQWRYHWHCVTRNTPWCTKTAMSMLRTSISLDITLKSHERDTDLGDSAPPLLT